MGFVLLTYKSEAQKDKVYHAVAGTALGIGNTVVVYSLTQDYRKSFILGSLLGPVQVGLIKEGLDVIGDGNPEIMDFVATAIPGIAASYITVLINKKHNKFSLVLNPNGFKMTYRIFKRTKLGYKPIARGVDFTFCNTSDVVYSFKQTEKPLSYNYYLRAN